MATKFTIISGEKSETFTVKPRDILRSERDGRNDEAPIESTYRLAWYASGSDLEFDEWIGGVDDIIPIIPDDEAVEEEIPPTTAASRRSRSTQG